MILSPAQRNMHFALFGQICEKQGWAAESAAQLKARRTALYRELGLPESFSQFNRKHFNKFKEETAHLRNEINMDDNDRDELVHTITRLGIGIAEITGQAPGEYARRIMCDWADTNDLDKLAKAQAATLQDKGHRDLTNLSMTLKNRLSKMLTAVKDGEIERPDLLGKWLKKEMPRPNAAGVAFPHISNNEIIAKLIAGRALADIEDDEPQPLPLRPPATAKRGYVLTDKKKNFQPRPQLQPATTAPDEDDNRPF